MNELEKLQTEKKWIPGVILNNARTLMIIFILFVVVVVMTTDIRFVTVSDLKNIGLEFFLLLFCSYAMYVCCADGGMSKGYATDAYKVAVARFGELKQQLLEDSKYSRLNEFCAHYVEEELKNTRMQYLIVAAVAYDDYLKHYVKLSRGEIKALPELSKMQKKAIRRANRVRQIRFTPDMITSMQGKTFLARFTLYATPQVQRSFAFGMKFVKMSLLSIGMSLIALEIILEPSWTVFAEVCMKLSTVVVNGFDGHKMGFRNIAVDAVNYTGYQCDLMQQALRYIEGIPPSKMQV